MSKNRFNRARPTAAKKALRELSSDQLEQTSGGVAPLVIPLVVGVGTLVVGVFSYGIAEVAGPSAHCSGMATSPRCPR
jgi:lactobin A/cerein 7B family class IIb bacteriocin